MFASSKHYSFKIKTCKLQSYEISLIMINSLIFIRIKAI
nr:MAG TPA: hypothetical protein [Caudoviricetes sp.]